MTDVHVKVATLGSFGVSVRGRAISLNRAKDKALVAFLAANKGRSFQRAFLANLLWGGATESKALHSLSQSVYSISRLMPGLIVSEHNNISCYESVECDILGIQSNVKAKGIIEVVDHLPGEFLHGLSLGNARDFEDWKAAVNAQLFRHLEQALSAALGQLSPEERAISFLGSNVRIREWFPSIAAEFAQLESARAVGHPLQRAASIRESEPVYVRNRPNETPFVGRDRHLIALLDLAARTHKGESRFVLIKGEAGHGKTRLVTEFLSRINQSANLILKTRCFEAERRIGFGPISEIVAAFPHSAFRGMDPLWTATLGAFRPSTSRQSRDLPALSADGQRARFFEAVCHLIEQAAQERPLIIFLDDLQWCDNSTRALLSYLTRRIKQLPLMIIGAVRVPSDAASKEPFRNWDSLGVDELDDCAIKSLVQNTKLGTCANVEEKCERIRKLTGGHPYLINEIVQSFSEDATREFDELARASKSIQEFVGALLGSLPAPAQSLIAILAVLRRPAPAHLVRRVTRKKDIGQLLDLLVTRRVLEVRGRNVSFRHDLVREAAYARIPIFTRADIHMRAAALLKHSKRRSGEAAEHYYHSGDRRSAYRLALRAVAYADSRHASDEAIYFIRLAIRALPPSARHLRPALIERLVRAHRLKEARAEISMLMTKVSRNEQSAVTLALTDLESAHELGDLHPEEIQKRLQDLECTFDLDAHSQSRLLQLRIRAAYNAGAMDEVERSANKLHKFAIEHAGTAEGDVALSFAVRAAVSFSVRAAQEWAEILRHTPANSDLEFKVRTAGVLCIVEYASGRLLEAEKLARAGISEIKQIGAMNLWPTQAGHLQMLLVEQGNYDEAKRLSEELNPEAESLGAIQTLVTLAGNDAYMFYEVGDFHSARRMCERARHYLERKVSVPLQTQMYGLLGLCELELGHIHKADEVAKRVHKQVAVLHGRMDDASHAEILLARMAIIRGDRAAAIGRLEERINAFRDGDTPCRLRLQLELARILRSSDKQESRRLANQVFHEATAGNMRPIAERADGLLLRT